MLLLLRLIDSVGADHYCLPGSDCLRNKLGLEDSEALIAAEARIVSVREVELLRNTLPGEYNLEHLKRFHARLFGDVYGWAGETRTVNIHKGQTTFCAWNFVDEQTSSVLGELEQDRYLTGWTRKVFVERLAHYYSELNAVHPFREGNGRSNRSFLRQLSAAAGWRIDWSGLGAKLNIEISIDSFHTANPTSTVAALDPLVSQI